MTPTLQSSAPGPQDTQRMATGGKSIPPPVAAQYTAIANQSPLISLNPKHDLAQPDLMELDKRF